MPVLICQADRKSRNLTGTCARSNSRTSASRPAGGRDASEYHQRLKPRPIQPRRQIHEASLGAPHFQFGDYEGNSPSIAHQTPPPPHPLTTHPLTPRPPLPYTRLKLRQILAAACQNLISTIITCLAN